MESAKPKLSVVIIAKNEEKYIDDCIKSILSVKDLVSSLELILIDSNSTDRTREIALDNGITVYRLSSNVINSPSAGRYIGTLRANYNNILFVDGDMVLNFNWMHLGLKLLFSDDNVAGVSGNLQLAVSSNDSLSNFSQVKTFGGIGLFKKKCIVQAGHWDPFVRSNEEADLCYRIRDKGYILLKTEEKIASHLKNNPESFSEIYRRLSLGFYSGPGQVLRKSFGNKNLFFSHIFRLRLSFLILFLIGLNFAVFFLQLNLIYLIITDVTFLMFLSRNSHGFFPRVIKIIRLFMLSFFLIPSFMSSPKHVSEYPTDVSHLNKNS